MIVLHTFGPFMGTPDASPFVMKAMLLLKHAGLPYTEKSGTPFGAPHGLLPYIDDDGRRVADSTMIRAHIEKKYGFDFDAGLDASQKATAWTIERMCEDHLYFAILRARWLDREVFDAGIARLFAQIPAPVRPLVKAVIRKSNEKRLKGHGLGRLTEEQIQWFAMRDLDALAQSLGDKPYLMGDAPCGVDATAFGMLTALLVPDLAIPLRAVARQHANLVAYQKRVAAKYFPETKG